MNFDTSRIALQGVCPNNDILYDNVGMPSFMVKIPKMTYAELGMGESTAVHPAFIINGQEVPEIFISKFQNIVNDGRAYSLPGVDPRTSVTFDAAIDYCTAKGEGWHLMTRMEWGLLVRWCQNNGVMPKGNNNWGRHDTEAAYKAIPSCERDGSGRIQRIATGTGPLTWYHDQTPSGIADLCGNVWEWTGGVRTVFGELQVLANNNGADVVNSQGVSSMEWKCIRGSDGALITPNGSGTTPGSVKLDFINNKLVYSTSKTDTSTSYHAVTFANITCDATVSAAAKLILQDLGMLQYGSAAELFSGQTSYFNSYEAERLFDSGCRWAHPGGGIASFSGNDPRSHSNGYIGFRSAYAKLPTA